MESFGVDELFVHPRIILGGGLPQLRIAKPGEAAPRASLGAVFSGDLGDWDTFEHDVEVFYTSQAIQNALNRCKDKFVDANFPVTKKMSTHYADLGHAMIAEERELHGRFLNNVTDPLQATLKTILSPRCVPHAEIDELKKLPLTRSMHVRSAKLVASELRDNKEPDIIFRIPRRGMKAEMRNVGELKFCGTCDLEKGWDNLSSKGHHSMRHKLGQIARDMRACGLRFGFMSTYEKTIFLKIVEQPDGTHALHRSKCYHFTDKAHYDPLTGKLSGISVRLGLAYLVYRASNGNRHTWSFQPAMIKLKHWIEQHNSKENFGLLAWVYQSPFTPSGQEPDTFDDASVTSGSSEDEEDGANAPAQVAGFVGKLHVDETIPADQHSQTGTPQVDDEERSPLQDPSPTADLQERRRIRRHHIPTETNAATKSTRLAPGDRFRPAETAAQALKGPVTRSRSQAGTDNAE